MNKNSAGKVLNSVKDVVSNVKNYWLLSKNTAGLSAGQRTVYFIFNAFLVICAAFALCVSSLAVAYGPAYSDRVFDGYFENPLILLLNFLPVLGLFVVLYALIGRGWICYLAESIIVLGLTFANFFLLKFRDDVLMFSDILYFREALQISSEGYKYELTDEMIGGILACLFFVVVLALFQRFVPSFSSRLYAVTLVLTVSFMLTDVYLGKDVYDKKTDNYDVVIRWAPTQKYVAKGFVYPFVHSIAEVLDVKPEGYNEKRSKELLSEYKDGKIDKDKRVNVIGVMLEAYCDLENIGIEGIDKSVYELYRMLKDENLSGTLVTNIFAAGTIDSERAFLTGYPDIEDYRRNVNSHVRFFSSQGYTVDGSHPSENWFYNRQNSNGYLGFSQYRFAENYFLEKYGDMMRADSIVFDDFYENYVSHVDTETNPYFGFHVTYQGHAPYETTGKYWGTDENPLYHGADVSSETDCILNNYFGTIKDTGWRLWQFVEKIKQREEPCVLIVFGDHKPWLGDGNSVYEELGINIDVSTKEGFLNYYGTEYVIVANDAAKELLDKDFVGEGPMTSPCFLMNVLFDSLGYEGSAYMQYTDTVMKEIPVLNEVGIIDKNGDFYLTEEMPEKLSEIYSDFKGAAYYTGTNFNAE